jgi:glycosyltransferase involved in cell wall biosynthesis
MPSSAPVVSVVIPTYNRAHCLPRAIESVLSQSYDRMEIIVVNDGSTDDTQSVLAEYGNRLHVISQPNAGVSAARNAGVLASRGEIVTFLDSDDEWMSSKVERQVLLLESAGPSTPCCFCNMVLNYADGRRGSSFGLSLLQPAEKEGKCS